MKSVPVDYLGFTAMDRKFSSPMLPWVISQIRRRNVGEKINLVAASEYVTAYASNKEHPLFKHPLRSTLKPQLLAPNLQETKGCSFLYMLKGDDGLYYCHLFKAKNPETVQELFSAMKEQSSSSSSSSSSKADREKDVAVPQRSNSNAATLTTLGADISPSSSHFFEVFYVGKIKINSHEICQQYTPTSRYIKVPESFIDDVLIKFRARGLEKSKSSTSGLHAACQQLKQQTNDSEFSSNKRRDSMDSNYSELGSSENMSKDSALSSFNSSSLALTDSVEKLNNNNANDNDQESKAIMRRNNAREIMRARAMSTGNVLMLRRDSKGGDEHNRTMLFQVGRHDLRLISPDRKQVLLHKQLKDVACCAQGVERPKHFGFICKDPNLDCFVAYVFKCQSEPVADDLVGAISQAFVATYNGSARKEKPVFSCEHCPMVWYNKLCQEIEGQSDKKVQSVIFSRLEMLPEDEQEIVVNKYKGGTEAAGVSSTKTSLREQNEFLIALLRAHCESKQTRHVHDTAENRSEFLNQYLSVGVGSTIFMKAKRSLTNSFDHLMKRKGSKDDFGFNAHVGQNNSLQKAGSLNPAGFSPTGDGSDSRRPRSLRVSPEQQLNIPASPKSPMMDIFLKVGNSPKMSPTESDNNNRLQESGSWRQAILHRVVTPGKDQGKEDNGVSRNGRRVSGVNVAGKVNPARKRTREELRELWRNAINQQLILIRMEKENAKLKVHQEEATVKRIKLEYDELSSVARELVEVWDLLVSKESRISTKCNNQMLLQAIKQGVPRGKRGEVWQFLAEQFCLNQPPIDTKDFPNYNVPYELLLKQLTSQQHAILIDLGRTFPNHPYFSSPLGPGQLALFNLLKAYSLLDHEVGYCQGLSFVAGVLLLHMAEDQAFFLLRHLMFRRGLRKLYLPDMAALQLHLYQLSRLLHDRLPDIYNHFDKHEVSPTLYAAPWLLTLFASQFPLGFVTRVFDLLFLESSEVIFKVALALLEDHQDQLLSCDSFEDIMEYLKVHLLAVDKTILDRVMKRVFYPDMEIGKHLNEYRVEYQVLQEEMLSVKSQMENIEKLELLNKQLTQQNGHLAQQLDIVVSNWNQSEKMRSVHQSNLHKLESHNRGLEVTVATLGAFIQQMIESRVDYEIPGEVRRIVAQMSLAEKRAQLNPNRSFPLMVIEDNSKKYDMVKSNSTGRETQRLLNNAPFPLKSTMSQPNLGTRLEKVSSFFANSHNHIKQQRALREEQMKQQQQQKRNDENDPKAVNIDIQITDMINLDSGKSESLPRIIPEDPGNLKVDACIPLEKSVSLPLNNKMKLKSSKSAYELGSVKKIPTTKLEDTIDDSPVNLVGTMHPLDTCSDVNFKYGGTTKLKSIKPVNRSNTGQGSSRYSSDEKDEDNDKEHNNLSSKVTGR